MAKRIHEYTKTRTSGTFQDDDYMDFDSTEDAGITFESAKGKVLDFVNYLKTAIGTLYTANGTLTSNRNITAATFITKWLGGNITVEMVDSVTDYAFTVNDGSSSEKARLGFDQGDSSAILTLSNSLGDYFQAIDGKIGINHPAAGLDTLISRNLSAAAAATVFKGLDSGAGSVFVVNANGAFTSGNITGTEALLSFGRSYMGIGTGSAGIEFLKFGGNIGTGTDKLLRMKQEVTTAAMIMDLYNGGGAIATKISAGNEDSYFNNGGNVGVGISSPTSKLHVVGDFRLDETVASGKTISTDFLPINVNGTIRYIALYD